MCLNVIAITGTFASTIESMRSIIFVDEYQYSISFGFPVLPAAKSWTNHFKPLWTKASLVTHILPKTLSQFGYMLKWSWAKHTCVLPRTTQRPYYTMRKF